MKTLLILLTLLLPTQAQTTTKNPTQLKIMTWNIWHGGRENGKQLGPKQIIDVIKNSNAEIIAMQETYGSGERISKALSYHFHPKGTNVSIHSKFPITEDISVGHPFNCAGAIIQISEKKQIAFYSIWLPYNGDCWGVGAREKLTTEKIQACCHASNKTLTKMLADIKTRLADPKYKNIPIIIAGDFNSMSHLDYTAENKDQFHHIINWPTSNTITKAGFTDTYRIANPKVERQKDATWSPRFPKQQQDRIDFIYHNSKNLKTLTSKIIKNHTPKFPSDHAALLTTLKLNNATH